MTKSPCAAGIRHQNVGRPHRWRFLNFALFFLTGTIVGAPVSVGSDSSHAPPPELPLIRTPSGIVANRTLPTGVVTTAGFQTESLSDLPTDEEIFRARLLTEPFVPTAPSANQADNSALIQAMRSYRANPASLSSFEAFVAQHPTSRWAATVELNLGLGYQQTCHFTKAFASFEQALTTASTIKTPAGSALADHAAAQLYRLNARVGRVDALLALNQATRETIFTGTDNEMVSGAEAGLWTMQKHPEAAFLCGPAALEKIAQVEFPTSSIPICIRDAKSTPQGFSLLNVWRLSEQAGLNLQIVKREPGSALVTPSVVHWKVGHFAAVLANNLGVLRIEDTTFGGSNAHLTATLSTLDEEGTGYMLIPKGPLLPGYRSVSETEAGAVFGKGDPSGNDVKQTGTDTIATGPCPPLTLPNQVEMPDGEPPPDGGMPVASAILMVCSLRVSDTPLSYAPPVGPAVAFHLIYNQREASQPAVFFYGNLGQQWVSNWLSYVTEVVTPINVTPPGIAENIAPNVNVPGGGTEYYQGIIVESGSQTLPPPPYDFGFQAQSHAHLIKITPSAYEQINPDGSMFIFGFKNNSTYFVTEAVDAQGNTETFGYDASTRIIAVTDAIGQVTTLAYNDPLNSSHITNVTDPFGRTCLLTYDSQGRLVTITDTIGMTSSVTYQGSSTFINSMTTPYGTSTFSYSEPAAERYLYLTDPLGGTEELHYLPSEGSPAATGPLPANMIVTALNQDDCNTYYWDKKAYMDAPGLESAAHLYHWNHTISGECSGNLENEKLALEGSRTWYNYEGQTSVSYDGTTANITSVGRVLDDGTTQLRSFTYNSFGKVTTAVDPLGRTDSFKYVNNVDLSEVDHTTGTGGAHDVLATYTYNAGHRPLTAVDASGQTTQMTYNARGQLLTLEDAKSETTTLAYDINGYQRTVTGPFTGAVYSFSYDGFGRLQTVTDPDSLTLTTDYDALNRPTILTFPDGTYQQNSYKYLDLEWQRDRLGRMTHLVHDSVRHLVQTEDQLYRSTYYAWCLCGSLLGITDPNGNQTSWTRDVQGRVTKKTFADTTSISYAYESSGSRLKATTDALNQTTNWTYNGDNSIAQISFTGAINPTPSVSYTYDPVYLRLISRLDGIGTTTYAYNSIPTTPTLGSGRIASITGPLANSTLAYSYDQLGRVLTTSVNGAANTMTVGYDPLGRITSSSNPLGSFTYTYDAASARLLSEAYPNGQSAAFSYYPNSSSNPGNGLHRLQQIFNNKTGEVNLSNFSYSYNLNGTIQSWTKAIDNSSPITSAFKYDSADQLTDASGPTLSLPTSTSEYAYRYDGSGNRISEQINDSSSSATANPINQFTSISGTGTIRFSGHVSEPANVAANSIPATVDTAGNFAVDVPLSTGAQTVSIVAIDGNGNSTTKNFGLTVGNNSARTLNYDANGNLLNNGAGQVYAWDAENRLIGITQASGITGFVYNGLGQRVQETLNGTVIKQWVWNGGTQPVEERDGSNNVTKRFFGGLGEQIGGVSYYFTSDHLGSVREMTDGTGTTRARYDYDPYGRMTKISGDLTADFGFTGDYYHAASGLSLTMYRAYDPNLGRWLSRDPMGEAGGLNLYGYCLNDPVNLWDPLGLVAPPAIRGRTPDINTPDYANWGGPDYSGGWRPSQHHGQNGPGAPLDSMDQLFMPHDNAYGKYGITSDTQGSKCDSIQDPCERKKCQAKRRADNDVYQGLINLPDDPAQWPLPAAHPWYARAYRFAAEFLFKPTD
jgi:RHS repeat-associated protein